jgi:glycosyltransferase involved in cell wall biosynthesis
MPSRKAKYNKLIKSLYRINSEVEIISDDSMDYNIGVKRNKLLETASGDYIVFIDDDDTVSKDYVKLILEATNTNPDCIGISGIITTNGIKKRKWFISKNYGSWYKKDKIYYRTPNHISPVKREIAIKAMFPEIKFGEDIEYSKRILPFLKREVIITKIIYHYDYCTNKK